MEDNKRVFKFFGKPGEDYQLWSARTQAALYAKEVGDVIEDDILADDAVDEVTRKKVSTAFAIIIQGLGDKPLRLCLGERSGPFKMWRRLSDRYALSSTATPVQLQSKLSKLSYNGQVMGDYVDAFEDIFNRLAGMDSPISEELQVAMFLSSFGDLNRSKFGHAISALQNVQDKLSWETVTVRLLQAYEDAMWHSQRQKMGSSTLTSEESQALIAAKNWKRKPFNNHRRSSRLEFRSSRVLLDSGASDHMVPYVEWLTDVRKTPTRVIFLGDGNKVTSKWSGKLEICTALRGNGETLYRKVVLHDVLLVPALKSSLVSISKLCDGGYEMHFGHKRCVALKNGYMKFYGIKNQGIYHLDGVVTQNSTSYANAAVSSKSALETWCDRLGHV